MAKAQTISGMLPDYQAESDLRTLIEAQVIKNDPKRFKAAQKKAKEQADALEEAMEPEGADDEAGEK